MLEKECYILIHSNLLTNTLMTTTTALQQSVYSNLQVDNLMTVIITLQQPLSATINQQLADCYYYSIVIFQRNGQLIIASEATK